MTKNLSFILLLLFSFSLLKAQEVGKQTLYYSPSGSSNGLTPVEVNFKYQFMNSFGDIVLTKAATCQATSLTYRYKGEEYRFTDIEGSEEIRNITIDNPTIEFDVYGPNGFIATKRTLIVGSVMGGALSPDAGVVVFNVKTDTEKNPNNYYLKNIRVVSVSYENHYPLENIIEKHIAENKKKAELDESLRNGADSYSMNDFVKAKKYYTEALRLDNSNSIAIQKLSQIEEKLNQKEKEQQFNDLIRKGEEAEANENYESAKGYYQDALNNGFNDYNAQSKLDKLIDKQRLIAEELKKIEQKKAQELEAQRKIEEQKTQEKLDNDLAEMKKAKLEEESRLEEEQEQKRLADLEEKRLADLESKRLAEEEENRLADEKERIEDEKDKAERKSRRDKDLEVIQSKIPTMKYDSVLYVKYFSFGEEKLNEADSLQNIMFEATQLKKEWWDNNSFIQVIADDLYENQREDNFQKLMQLSYEVRNLYNSAKLNFLYSMHYVDYESDEYYDILDKIDYINEEIDFNEIMIKYGPEGEQKRKEIRELNKDIQEMNRWRSNHDAANAAYSNAERKNDGTNYNVERMDLENRLNQADQKYKEDAIAAGVTQAVVIDQIMNNDGYVEVGRYAVMNFSAGLGYGSHPVLENITSDVQQPITSISRLDYIMSSVELGFRWLNTNNLSLNMAGFGGLGLFPSVGTSNIYVKYGGNFNFDFGFKHVKLATMLGYEFHSGSQEIDYDVRDIKAGYQIEPSNKFGESSFNYTTLKLGGGLKIDLSDEESYGHILFLVQAEKPSFYNGNIFSDPIYSYSLNVLFKSGISVGINYGQNYFIAGEKKYHIPEVDDKDQFSFTISKAWTIINPNKL